MASKIMEAILIISTIFFGLIAIFALYSVFRLNKYIASLEEIVEEQIERADKIEEILAPLIKNQPQNRNLIPEE